MLSILIPTYNYDITELIKEIYAQCLACSIDFEIIVCEDGSENFTKENKKVISALPEAKHLFNEKNFGRIQTRQKLSHASRYDWLLFLDADVIPKSNNFIKNYINQIPSSIDAFFGGFSYFKNTSDGVTNLRLAYGQKFEEVDARKRNKNPYRLIISANFLIRKVVFNSIIATINYRSYGLDNYFAALLKQNNCKILHINNEVYHIGLESNKIFLEKTKRAVVLLLRLYKDGKMSQHSHKLLACFVIIKYLKLHHFVCFLYQKYSLIIEKKLISTRPNLYLLQIYKILFISFTDLNQKNDE